MNVFIKIETRAHIISMHNKYKMTNRPESQMICDVNQLCYDFNDGMLKHGIDINFA